MKSVTRILIFSFVWGQTLGESRIINGQEATPGQFPYVVSLHKLIYGTHWLHFCGGSILTTNTVLTSAACYDDMIFYAGIGDHELQENDPFDSKLRVIKMITPEPTEMYDNDIAIFVLEDHMTYTDRVQPTILPSEKFNTTGLKCTVCGWGRSEEHIEIERLQFVDVNTYDIDKCNEEWFGSVSAKNVCSKSTSNKAQGPCDGDHGTPYVCQYNGNPVQIGLYSWGSYDCSENLPAVYTSIFSYREWIDTQLESLKDQST